MTFSLTPSGPKVCQRILTILTNSSSIVGRISALSYRNRSVLKVASYENVAIIQDLEGEAFYGDEGHMQPLKSIDIVLENHKVL